MKQRVAESIFLEPVVEGEVLSIIKRLKNGSAGWDGIQARILKSIKSVIIKPLTHVLNLSLSTGTFPTELKVANVVPIFKSGDGQIFTNYRPVSVLPVFSKILERIMYNRLLLFLNKHKIIYDYQFGFREKYSTYLALITLTEKISDALNEGKHVIGIFLDFYKAFDTVNHEILLMKLENYGIRGVALNWFKSYLTNRQQFVTYNNCKSSTANVTCGVPQGSILGPLLFIVYINDLCHIAKHCFLLLFADDSNLFYTGHDLEELTERINEELNNIIFWLEVNKLSLNISKTHYMIFTRPKCKADDIKINVKDVAIGRVSHTKFLGVQIDDKLNWKQHIDYIRKKLSKSSGILKKARKYLPKECLKNLYFTFVYPYFTYCIHVWGKTFSTYLDPIIKVQKRIIRIITHSKYDEHTLPLFKQLNILTVNDIYDFSIATFMYKFANKELPDIFNDMFTKNRVVHDYSTRQADEFRVPIWNVETKKRSLGVQGAMIWNNTPDNVKESCSLNTFKYKLKKHLIELI